jgi:ElaB/YqjD/DUF883 family membrane-anchored ribosome-binding protein
VSNQTSGPKAGLSSQGKGKGSGAARSRMPGTRAEPNKQIGVGATITSQVQGALDQQLVRGARVVTNVARSARRAADELDNDAPQIAGLVRGMADRVEEYSTSLQNQSVTDVYQAASDFTRRQPAVVFGVAALAGFFALRTFKVSAPGYESGNRARRPESEEFYGS